MNTLMQRATRGEFVVTNSDAAVPVRLTSRTIIDISRTLGTRKVTVEFSAPHGFSTGALLYISGCDEDEFNTATLTDGFGQAGALVVAVPTSTTVVIMLDGSTSGATLTAPVCYADIWVRQATLLGKKASQTANADTVYIGTLSSNGAQPYEITSNAEAFLPAGKEGVGPLTNLGDWYLDVTTANDGLYVLYN